MGPGQALSWSSTRGLSLVELMVAVSILAVGIVAAVRGFIVAASALETVQNQAAAAVFLGTRMAQLEEISRQEEGLQESSSQDVVQLRRREATWTQEIAPVSGEPFQEKLYEVRLSLSWKEGNVAKEASLATYVQKES